jgi:nuclear pore complex protein Nup43
MSFFLLFEFFFLLKILRLFFFFLMDRHPFQGHIVAVGGYDGMLTVYDMRKAQTPVTVMEASDSCLNELRFHPERADHLFTASESGAVWHWVPMSAKTAVSSKKSFNHNFCHWFFNSMRCV